MASKHPLITLAPLVALAIVLGVAGCVSTPEPIAPPPAAGLPAYTIGAGDRIQVSVYNDNDLTGEYEVDERGSIVMPLVGAVDLQGQSLRDSEQTITTRIRGTRTLRDPRVAVGIVRYRQIYVLGEVQRPGSYPYFPGATVIRTVATAGGFTVRAKQDRIRVYRAAAGSGNAPEIVSDGLVLPGDVIVVTERIL
jgi:polysaccharide export outer membrane protein